MKKKECSERIEQKEILLEPPRGWLNLRMKELWEFRELLYFLTWRDIKVRYKQTFLGAAWAIIQPIITMVIFSIVFGKLAKLPSEGFPYPIFTYTALLPWQLFSRSLSDASASLISNKHMISKIYFPRIFLPISSILSSLVDFFIAFLVLLGMMVYYEIAITWRILFLPAFLLLAVISALAAGLWLSALNVRYRDIKYVTPFLLRVWLYATPIAYTSSLIPKEWELVYGLNPMVGIVNGFRWAILGQSIELSSLAIISTSVVLMFFISGLFYFQRMEQTFADLI
ncbi:MAG: ABC transporter permease [Anaerolineae bacterium]|jgi:lipopolysaccharide transport system permease protein|nr:ABC transporter permease [Anaerolineae bacterium]MBT7074707.1 ABC transporter permease [Anaerolineae bacterium]